jgi:hypothetical protein
LKFLQDKLPDPYNLLTKEAAVPKHLELVEYERRRNYRMVTRMGQ